MKGSPKADRISRCETLIHLARGAKQVGVAGQRIAPGTTHPDTREPHTHRKAKTLKQRLIAALEPSQQGELDSLCGLYAIMNAMRLAILPHGELTDEQEELILKRLVRTADRKWRFASWYLEGMGARKFLALVRVSIAVLYEITGYRLIYKPIPLKVLASANSLRSAVLEASRSGQDVILAGIEGEDLSHWTVITGASDTTLRVFDSSGGRYFMLRNCQLDYPQRPKTRCRYRVRPYGVLVLQANPSLDPKPK